MLKRILIAPFLYAALTTCAVIASTLLIPIVLILVVIVPGFLAVKYIKTGTIMAEQKPANPVFVSP